MLASRVLLAANFNSSVNIEDGLFISVLDVEEVFDCLLLVLLDVTIEQESCVILVVVDVALGTALRLLLISDQLVQVLDKVIELSDLDVVLDDVTRVQETNRLDILLNRFIILLLVEEFVGVFFNDLALNLSREVCLFCDRLRLCIVRLLHQVIDLDVVLHGIQANELTIKSVTLIDLSDVVNAFLPRSLLNLHIKDSAISRWVPVHRDLVLEVVNAEL